MKLKGKFPALAAIVESVEVPKGSGPCCMCHQGMAKQDLYQLCPDCQEEISNASELGLDYGSVASVTADAGSPLSVKKIEFVTRELEGTVKVSFKAKPGVDPDLAAQALKQARDFLLSKDGSIREWDQVKLLDLYLDGKKVAVGDNIANFTQFKYNGAEVTDIKDPEFKAGVAYASVAKVLAGQEGWTNDGAYTAGRSFYNNQSDFKAGEALFKKEGKAPLVGFLKKSTG